MYSLPSTSQIRAPSARSTKNGSRPNPRKARTGEFTPPGMRCNAWAKSWDESEGMRRGKPSYAKLRRASCPTPNVQCRIRRLVVLTLCRHPEQSAAESKDPVASYSTGSLDFARDDGNGRCVDMTIRRSYSPVRDNGGVAKW